MVRTTFDQEKTPVSLAFVATLAEMMDVDPVELDPLHATLDPDALEAIVRVRPGMEGDTQISFTHEDHAITVYSYGVITITPDLEPTAENYAGTAGR